ncbi:hypothetical protein F4782DRAFT_488432 [Xylaria castorea]|nr:hypothetical protein F4782DRAFT_488432 [Xylaria castorea]
MRRLKGSYIFPQFSNRASNFYMSINLSRLVCILSILENNQSIPTIIDTQSFTIDPSTKVELQANSGTRSINTLSFVLLYLYLRKHFPETATRVSGLPATIPIPPIMSANRSASPYRFSHDDKSEARRQDSFSSSESMLKDKDSSTPAHHSSWFNRSRSSSEGAHKAGSQHVNLYTHCGRHTDQYLFGGHSVSDSVKSLLGRKN